MHARPLHKNGCDIGITKDLPMALIATSLQIKCTNYFT
jgi:hypothetical protein